MALMSNLAVVIVVLCQNKFLKNQFTGAVASEISILAQTFSIITTCAMIAAFRTLVAQN